MLKYREIKISKNLQNRAIVWLLLEITDNNSYIGLGYYTDEIYTEQKNSSYFIINNMNNYSDGEHYNS